MTKANNATIIQLKSFLAPHIPEQLLESLPKRWWFLGDIVLFSLPRELIPYGEIIGKAFLQVLSKPVRSVLGKIGPTTAIIREPQYHLLAGDPNTETIHKELGCLFKLDAAKLTFSPGNHGERTRLVQITSPGEIIIDMFSCVGNLSLPLAVNNSPKKLIAAEINPLAFHYLQENIRLNKVESIVEAVFGDNCTTLPRYRDVADRVLVGYLFSSEEQIRLAIRLCRDGGIIHYHEAVPNKATAVQRPINRIHNAAMLEKAAVTILSRRIVKKYAPGIEHIVLDVRISKK
ncbi:MAG: class I SAM-dependent methyltransferase [Candidatus Heimdallarchaeota archaeon]|nr:MAG: class I SAM-dependent methyltransferase family protein [Candidatus Gerdarchaeota archaeon]